METELNSVTKERLFELRNQYKKIKANIDVETEQLKNMKDEIVATMKSINDLREFKYRSCNIKVSYPRTFNVSLLELYYPEIAKVVITEVTKVETRIEKQVNIKMLEAEFSEAYENSMDMMTPRLTVK